MSEFSKIRTARKRHRCDTQSYACARTIEPGQRYVYASAPPGGEWGWTSWQHATTCAACEVAYGRKHADAFRETP